MHTLVIDPRFGAAGDMIVASLISLGADKDNVLAAIGSVSTPTLETVSAHDIEALSIHMNTDHTHRTLEDVLQKVDAANTSDEAKDLAKRVFKRIETAEATVHHTQHPHFHEVGADDAVADIVGACTALLSLNITSVSILPVSTGFGTVECSHGTIPVPSPAAAEIFRNSQLKTIIGPYEGELCTPTGAALLAEFADTFPGTMTPGKIIAIGRGAGTRTYADHPNILTTYLMETDEPEESTVDVLETNVDDITGELLGNTLARMMAEGARDASAIPIIMKKGRSGYLIRVICTPKLSTYLSEILATETGSLGIRCTPMVHRFTADRTTTDTTVLINGKEYTASVKHASVRGNIYSRKAEFDDCRRIATETGLTVREIKRIFETDAWN
ncbi:MAG TPA: nickel pincer cofactor biosynthesis protein LarC [Methanocorpusculum sp.]|nr:nickel pincer cofactor biosynthesis protein LarC [Methanocorpusculum sp.]